LACGAVVRKKAYLSVAGFSPRVGLGGEEALLAIDLLSAGWNVQYVEDIVAYHWPSPLRDHFQRRVSEQCNDLWTCWLRRQSPTIAYETWDCVKAGMLGDRSSLHALVAAVRGLGWVAR
jgi:N-acetylglucosaminyl-diphospho-decaprenol L-rhamnosyltransferase